MKKLYNEIKDFLCGIASDKYLHCIVCLVLCCFVAHLYEAIGADTMNAGFWAIVTTMLIGLWKEAYDEREYGDFNLRDLLADVIGCVIGSILYLL